MTPSTIALNRNAPTHFVSNDDRLTVDVPDGALSSDQIAADGGNTSLLVRQILPASGSTAGGSGKYSFGTYLIQVIDATGKLASHGLRQPATLSLHYGSSGSALDVMHAYAVVNGSIPVCVNLDPKSGLAPSSTSSSARTNVPSPSPRAQTPTLGALAHPATKVDLANGMLTTSAPVLAATTSVSWGTNSPVATFGKPDPFEVNLSGGSLSSAYNIDVPPGPAGFKPPLSLAYNSAGVSDQHNPSGPAPWVGEGWNMTLGMISWSEHNVASGAWVNSWELSDAYGTGAELVPPTTTTSIYRDDTGNVISTPVLWHTAPETFAKIYSFQSPNPPVIESGTGAIQMPCFRVFLPSGLMEEFGCTPDSIQWYWQPTGANAGKYYIANWLLDLITDPTGNQIHITYQHDDVNGYGALNYPRDVQMATVEWDSPGCQNAQTICTGSAWAPLMRVNFSASHTVNRTVSGSCAPRITDRCDDPVNLSGSGGIASPTIESTFVLNDIFVQVRSSGTAGWNTLRDYQLSYDQSAPTTITDPVSGKQQSTAGKFVLRRLGVVGDDGVTAMPTTNFGYLSTNTFNATQQYMDMALRATPSTNCGQLNYNPGCYLWSQSYEGNSYYLESVSNGLGLAQSFGWNQARNNTHGVVAGGAPSDVFTCDLVAYRNQYPCYATDDGTWSRTVLVSKSDSVMRNSATTVTSNTSFSYQLSYPLSSQKCSDCVAGFSWGNQNDNDYLDFYNGKYLGFAQATVNRPDGSLEIHKYWATEGWGLYDTAQVACATPSPCHNDAWWDFTGSRLGVGQNNAAHGREYEIDTYDTNGTTLLKQVKPGYSILCPPTGVSGSPAIVGQGNWNGNLVSALDSGNPTGACSTRTQVIDTYVLDGSPSNQAPHSTANFVYDNYGRMIKETDTSNDGGYNGNPTTLVRQLWYVWNDNVSASATSVSGPYFINFTAATDTEDSATPANRYQCHYTGYDGQAPLTGQTSLLTRGLVTRVDDYTSCGNSGNSYTPSGLISRTSSYDTYGNLVATKDPDANAGNAAHQGCTGSVNSMCMAYEGTFAALLSSNTNALNQTSRINFQAPASGTASGGFGLWPISTSDVNSQITSYAYDALGRVTGETLPGEASGLTTISSSYTVWCSGTAAQTPCAEIDRTQRLNATTTVTARAFYNGFGQLVETRSPAPNGQDIVQYAYYDPSRRLVFKSVPYFVGAYTGGPGSAAYSVPDATQAGSTYANDGLGRTVSVTDALSARTTTGYSVVCNAAGTNDTACYEQVLTRDPLGHQSGGLTDSFARANYVQRYSGNSTSNYAVYVTTKYTYDYLGELTQIRYQDGTNLTSYQYDMAGRKTAMTDADRGSESYAYDQDGNLIQATDARGAGGTVYAGFDGIDRPVWRNTTISPTGAYDTYSYDSTAGGNIGIGRLTSETFSGKPNNSLTGAYSYVYGARGQQTAATLTVGSNSYPLNSTYDDAGSVLTQTYPDGETVTNSYTAQGWLSGVSTALGRSTTSLLSGAAYAGAGGPYGYISSANQAGTTYQYSAVFDLLARAVDIKVQRSKDGATMFEQARTFDAAGNVSTANASLTAGTDKQAFCYDEQNRLTWAGSVGTPPCTGTAISAGTLSAAQYTQTFGYDNLGRLNSGPLGSYAYGDAAHLRAVTAIGGTYTSAYDAAGNMTCRAPSASTTCVGTQNAAKMTYNNEGQLSNWQNQPSSPTNTAAFLYDGQGHRVVQQTTSGTTTTTTVYIGDLEQDATTGASTTKTTYYYANGHRFAMAVNGSFNYLASDGLGSANTSLDSKGNMTSSVLYAPYGSTRYSNGAMPTAYGFTGQIADSTSGLDYYGARYYDPMAAQFTSADTVLPGGGFDVWGLSRYAYVEGNPIIRTDPTGRIQEEPTGGGCAPSDNACLAATGQSTGASEQLRAISGSVSSPTPSEFAIGGSDQGGQPNSSDRFSKDLSDRSPNIRCPAGRTCIGPADPCFVNPDSAACESYAQKHYGPCNAPGSDECLQKRLTDAAIPLASAITVGAAWFSANAEGVSHGSHRINGFFTLISLVGFDIPITGPIVGGSGIVATTADLELAASGRKSPVLPLLDLLTFGALPSVLDLAPASVKTVVGGWGAIGDIFT
jgi:RHS repeat-associated protein